MSYESWSVKKKGKFLHYAGLTIENFNAVFNLLGYEFNHSRLKYHYDDNTPLKDYTRPKLSLKSCLLLVLIRLRRGLPLEDLADCFGISATHASTVFYTWIRYMYLTFKKLAKPMAVSAKHQRKGKPPCFRPFPKLRMILDSTEFRIERPSNLRHQGNTHSSYKGCNTVKFAVGSSTQGGTSWISGGYEGRISDKGLITKEKFVEILDEEDMVMVDRGFPIDEILAAKKAKVLRPPSFKKGKTNLTAKEEAATKAIAMVRIYVEHLIGRIKFFRLLNQRFEIHLLPYLTDLVYIGGFLCNFDRPYIGRITVPKTMTTKDKNVGDKKRYGKKTTNKKAKDYLLMSI